MRVVPALWITAAACAATLSKPAPPDTAFNVNSHGMLFEIDRGYRIAVLPASHTSVIRLDVRYPVGSADDPPGKAGLAHLVEHLLFALEYTQGDRKTSIGVELNRITLGWNAETATDVTDFQSNLLPAQLDAAIELEANRMAVGCAGITPAIFEREREVVLNELRERQGAAGAAVRRTLFEAIYPEGHPYRAVDSVETVSALTLEDACQFLAGPYQRGDALVVVSGAVAPEAVQAAVGKAFGRLRHRVPAPPRAVPPVPPAHAQLTRPAPVAEPTWFAAWPLPPQTSADFRTLAMTWDRFKLMMTYFAVTEHWGTDVSATVIGGRDAPVLVVGVTLASADRAGDAAGALHRALDFTGGSLYRPGDDRTSPGWVRLWHSWAAGDLAAWASLAGRNQMAAEMLAGNEVMLVGRIRELVDAAPQHTRELMETWLAPDRARTILLTPNGTVSQGDARPYAGGPETPTYAVDGTLADGPVAEQPKMPVISPEQFDLDNGLHVELWPDDSSPVVYGRLVLRAGWGHDPPGKGGVARIAALGDVVDADSIIVSDIEIAPDMDRLIGALTGELRAPGASLPDDIKNMLKAKVRAGAARELLDYGHDFSVALYGAGHPYAASQLTEADVDRLHTDLLTSWLRSHVVPRNAVLIVSGDFDPALVKQYIRYDVEHVSGGDVAPVIAAPAQRTTRHKVRGVHAQPMPTVALDVDFVAGKGLDAGEPARLVLAQVLAAQLSELRNQRALTYGMSATYEPRSGGGLWKIGGSVDAARAAEAAAAVEHVLDQLRHDPESYRATFVVARRRVLDELAAATTDASAIAGRLASYAALRAPENYDAVLATGVAALTLADFAQLAASDLAAGGEVFGAFGNAAAVDAALAAVPP